MFVHKHHVKTFKTWEILYHSITISKMYSGDSFKIYVHMKSQQIITRLTNLLLFQFKITSNIRKMQEKPLLHYLELSCISVKR